MNISKIIENLKESENNLKNIDTNLKKVCINLNEKTIMDEPELNNLKILLNNFSKNLNSILYKK